MPTSAKVAEDDRLSTYPTIATARDTAPPEG